MGGVSCLGGAAGRRSRWANCARSRNSFFSRLSRSCLMRATMAEASRFPSGPITALGLGGLISRESIDVAMVSSSGSLCDRRDRAGLGPRGSKPLAFGLFFFGGEGEGVFTSSSTFGAFLKSLAKRPGFGLLTTSPSTSTGVAGVPGERGMLVVVLLCLGAAYPVKGGAWWCERNSATQPAPRRTLPRAAWALEHTALES